MKSRLSEPFLLNPSESSFPMVTDSIDQVPKEIEQNLFAFNEKELEKLNDVSIFQIFRYANRLDYFYMILGSICAIGNGLTFPIFSIVFGRMTNDLVNSSNIMESAKTSALLYLLIGAAGMILSFGSLSVWMITGERQNLQFRKEYFRAILRQEISWFDSINPAQLTTKISNDTSSLQSFLGEKISTFFFITSMAISSYLVGYYWNYKLTLILQASTIPLAFAGACFGWSLEKWNHIKNSVYEKSGGFAEQALFAIRTVVGLTGEKKEQQNYESGLEETISAAKKWGIIVGAAIGIVFFCLLGEYGLGLYYGSILIEEKEGIQTGDILGVFFAVTTGTFSLGGLSPIVNAFVEAKRALQRVIWLIDRIPPINIENKKGKIIDTEFFEGEITFENVTFSYPNNDKITVLNKINITFEKGKKTALVGKSGCGKSTCMQLIERFYDTNSGRVCLDGEDIRDIQIESLRNNIGYVGQEPVLFATTIKENLKFSKPDASDEELIDAVKKANAYEFIKTFPNSFDTYIGSGGGHLSGGQKQRIAIARAFLKNPKILLLDEATSALDRQSELEIQKPLEEITKGRTTIVIAHRLSTIQHADRILVLENGKIVEEGTHQTLIDLNGTYYNMVKGQILNQKSDEKEEIEEFTQYEEEERKKMEMDMNDEEKSFPGIQEKDNAKNLIDITLSNQNSRILECNPMKNNEKFRKNHIRTEKIEIISNTKYSDAMIMKRMFSVYDFGILSLYITSFIFSVLNGIFLPFSAIIFAEMLEVLSNPIANDFRSRSNFLCIIFTLIAVLSFFSRMVASWSSMVSSSLLSLDLRKKFFKKLLSLHIAFFDEPEHTPGTLATRLQEDIELINRFGSSIIELILEALSSLFTGIVISFVYSWQISLCIVFTTPLLLYCSKLQEELNSGFSAENSKAYNQSAGILGEAVNNMRTVISFGTVKLLSIYDNSLSGVKNLLVKKAFNSGLIYGVSVFLNLAINALSFYLGMLFMSRGEVTFKEMYCSVFALTLGAMSAGSVSQYMPDVGKTKNAAQSVYRILDTQTKITNTENEVKKNISDIKGDIEFVNVSFKYPTREKQIFKNLNFKISAGKKIAFVGASGCGKSTIIGLLLRFYDVDEGAILLDGINIKEYNLYFLRRLFGLVSQEPVIFNGTIEYNLKYIRENATDEEMKEAVRNANALDFIEKNENESMLDEKNRKYGVGFQRLVGPKGSQISGGQKQRIAIARAIINKPKILLLDEATSALDAQNEKIVQESLDNIMHGYTSIVIAHRLSTIKDADEIFVFKDGNLVEKGVFEELIEKKGEFWILSEGNNEKKPNIN